MPHTSARVSVLGLLAYVHIVRGKRWAAAAFAVAANLFNLTFPVVVFRQRWFTRLFHRDRFGRPWSFCTFL
jgi:hypothetical protein